jgi:hypothetical protein
MREPWAPLAALVRAQVDEMEPWESAELHLLEGAFRDRLDALGVRADCDVAVALMAVSELLCHHTPEWGGDVRTSVGEIGMLGLRLLNS